MRKDADLTEVYITKLMNLFYGKKENLYKNHFLIQDSNQILVKFIKNYKEYFFFQKECENLEFLNKVDGNSEFLDKIDQNSVLKFMITNFFIQNKDLNSGNFGFKKTKDQKLELIAIDFGRCYFGMDQYFIRFIEIMQDDIKKKDFFETKKFLICGTLYKLPLIINKKINEIPDQDFIKVFTQIFENFNEIKDLLKELKTKESESKNQNLFCPFSKEIENFEESLSQVKEMIDSFSKENEKSNFSQDQKSFEIAGIEIISSLEGKKF